MILPVSPPEKSSGAETKSSSLLYVLSTPAMRMLWIATPALVRSIVVSTPALTGIVGSCCPSNVKKLSPISTASGPGGPGDGCAVGGGPGTGAPPGAPGRRRPTGGPAPVPVEAGEERPPREERGRRDADRSDLPGGDARPAGQVPGDGEDANADSRRQGRGHVVADLKIDA